MIIAVPPVRCRDATLAMSNGALRAIAMALILLLAGCIKVATTTYSSATEERSLGVQVDDTRTCAKVKRGLLEVGVKNAMALDVFCHRGVVVLAGVADPKVAEQSVAIAQKSDGVKRVETYLLPERPSGTRDGAIGAKIKARIIGDRELKSSQVEIAVVGGHVVLAGLVDSQAKIDRFVSHAQAVEGVVDVTPFIQLTSQ
jgi:hyperosmotically inducible periplasmic protein